ncbi:glutaredoxin family protein [Rheinheimera salexigens]|uniref:NrdH-redoxin n=1 Tax=Rheinheimera salexigens TaxID=1628148 RepID=A0A1E7Q680_9GAMM|nr:glutaredoxin family protein [Rheinheimera salexigens]OEY69694.1 NrdH-redoxin [Rheinheimera salexigens]
MNKESITLYSTWGCHLCDSAEALLRQNGQAYQVIDIVDDAAALAKYRLLIPVIAVADKELNWPFDAEQLATWLKEVE